MIVDRCFLPMETLLKSVFELAKQLPCLPLFALPENTDGRYLEAKAIESGGELVRRSRSVERAVRRVLAHSLRPR
ncbi:MAG: hypothetical protein VB878_03710, partial [Pirellulaceae bacterium]